MDNIIQGITGHLLAYDGENSRFLPIEELDSDGDFPVAQAPEYAVPQAVE